MALTFSGGFTPPSSTPVASASSKVYDPSGIKWVGEISQGDREASLDSFVNNAYFRAMPWGDGNAANRDEGKFRQWLASPAGQAAIETGYKSYPNQRYDVSADGSSGTNGLLNAGDFIDSAKGLMSSGGAKVIGLGLGVGALGNYLATGSLGYGAPSLADATGGVAGGASGGTGLTLGSSGAGLQLPASMGGTATGAGLSSSLAGTGFNAGLTSLGATGASLASSLAPVGSGLTPAGVSAGVPSSSAGGGLFSAGTTPGTVGAAAGAGDFGTGLSTAAGVAGAAGTVANGAASTSIWDDIAKAVGGTATAAGASNSLKDIFGGLIGAYGANDTANTYADAMKYAVDKADPFASQRPLYQTLFANMNNGTTNPMETPWMQNLNNTTLDNGLQRLTSKYGGEVNSLGVKNELTKQMQAASTPTMMDYLKTIGNAAGMNIQPNSGAIAAQGATGAVPLNNQIYGNAGVAGNSILDMMFRNINSNNISNSNNSNNSNANWDAI